MKENANKYLDNIAKKVITQNGLESPSQDFTQHVMFQLEGLEHQSVTTYKPLISKAGWLFIILGFIAVVVLVYFTGNGSNASGWFDTLDFSGVLDIKASHLFSQLKIPDTLLYPLLFLSLLIWIQVPFLRTYYKKRLQL